VTSAAQSSVVATPAGSAWLVHRWDVTPDPAVFATVSQLAAPPDEVVVLVTADLAVTDEAVVAAIRQILPHTRRSDWSTPGGVRLIVPHTGTGNDSGRPGVRRALAPDILDPARGAVVPLNVRTDGSWIWTDMVTYYLNVYGMAPDPQLLSDLETTGYTMPAVDSVAMHRAMVALARPADDEPVWALGA
jgi:hypothetical protein